MLGGAGLFWASPVSRRDGGYWELISLSVILGYVPYIANTHRTFHNSVMVCNDVISVPRREKGLALVCVSDEINQEPEMKLVFSMSLMYKNRSERGMENTTKESNIQIRSSQTAISCF